MIPGTALTAIRADCWVAVARCSDRALGFLWNSENYKYIAWSIIFTRFYYFTVEVKLHEIKWNPTLLPYSLQP